MKKFLLILLLTISLQAQNIEQMGDQAYVDGNVKQAIKYFKQASSQGWVSSEYKLGYIFEKQGDILQAHQWYKKAAEHGLPDAQFVLGIFYATGTSINYTPKDDQKALFWWKEATKNGYKRAEYNIRILCGKKPYLCH